MLTEEGGDLLWRQLLNRGCDLLLAYLLMLLWLKLWLRLRLRTEGLRLASKLIEIAARPGSVGDLLREAQALRVLLELLSRMAEEVVVVELPSGGAEKAHHEQ